MCKHRIKSEPIGVDEDKKAEIRLGMRWQPVCIIDTNTHTEVECVRITQRDGQTIPQTDERHYLFDIMKAIRNMPQYCNDLPTVSGTVTLQLPSYARSVGKQDENPYIMVYIEQPDGSPNNPV